MISKIGSNIKILVVIMVVVGVGVGSWFFTKKGSGEIFQSTEITSGDLTIKILATGTVQPENRLEIKPPVAGRVESVLVKEGQKVRKGEILAWLSSSERAALIDAARSKGNEEVKQWEELYKPTPLVAPLGGTIILRNVESGQTFTTGDAVLVMSDRLTVKAQVDETDLAQIYLKQRSEIILDAYPNQVLEASVDQVAYEAKTVNNVTTYLIDVLPASAPDYMRSGMTANVTFIGETKSNIALIPNEFIKYENGKPFALVKDPEEKNPVMRELQLGLSDGKNSEVISGVQVGDRVVLVINKKDLKSNASPFGPSMGGGRRR